MKKFSLKNKQAKPKPLQNKASMNQPVWESRSTSLFQVVSKYTILLGAFLLLAGGVSQDRYETAVWGILAACGIGTVVGDRKHNSHLGQENDEPDKMLPEKPQDRLDILDTVVDCLEDNDPLTDPLEKLEQAILSDVRNW
jgi:hypothetical protein